ncbi:ATP-dependent Clp protease proteolytic subunit [Azospirillum halopraeferens]|uniref:ATP-dependent Clp protease proteolytic subunit n=1 Tax=Azospirillum halopraeferens TaxID=34010 RepID=UPI0004286CA7|nr:ATP-dependent Clp protease proteolytic subunit [Azospirillum halopraeferens]
MAVRAAASAVLALVAAMAAAPAQAGKPELVATNTIPALPDAEITRTDHADATILRIDGIITKGVERRFTEALRALPAGRPLVVELDSPGGYTSAGYRMIDLMVAERAAGRTIATRVKGGESCESMCVGVYLAGYPRYADATAEFMVHAPRMVDNGRMTLRTTETMVKRLVSLGASEGWVARVRAAGGFSGKTDYRTRADHLTAERANVVTDLLQ